MIFIHEFKRSPDGMVVRDYNRRVSTRLDMINLPGRCLDLVPLVFGLKMPIFTENQ
jgi:hypothetical protein